MPVQKYRHVGEMPRVPRVDDRELVPRITALWRRANELRPLRVVPGVWRFRSIEEANAARNEATWERMRKLRSGNPE